MDDEKLIKLWNSGAHITEIEKAIPVSHRQYLYTRAAQLRKEGRNIASRKRFHVLSETPTSHYPEVLEKIKSLASQGLPLRKIGKCVGLSFERVRQIIKNHEYPCPGLVRHANYLEKQREEAARKRDLRKQEEEARMRKILEFAQAWRSGCSVEDLVRQGFGSSVNYVNVRIVNLRKKYPSLFPYRNKVKS